MGYDVTIHGVDDDDAELGFEVVDSSCTDGDNSTAVTAAEPDEVMTCSLICVRSVHLAALWPFNRIQQVCVGEFNSLGSNDR